jgi:hypothetical protein
MALVDRITIRSAWLPDITINKPLERSTEPNPVLDVLKPSFIIESGYSGKPVTMSPYGEPGETRWPLVKIGLIVVLGLGVFTMLGRKKNRR